MKTFIAFILLVTIGVSFADMDSFKPVAIKECDEIIWITPTYKNPREYMKISVPKGEVSDGLIKCFSSISVTENTQAYTMDSESPISGFLVFRKSNSVIAVFEVEPHTQNKKSVRFCEWLLQEDGMIVLIKYGGLVRAFVAGEEYRHFIERIKRPESPSRNDIFRVYLGYR